MEPGTLYLIGAGTTTKGIMDELGLPNTLLGIDAVLDRKPAGTDLYGAALLSLIGRHKRVKLIVTVTGGQGFLFGRGNQQLTPEVLKAIGRENILIAAAPAKLAELQGRDLLVDTGDEDLDTRLSGYYRVLTGYAAWTMCRIAR